MAETRDKFVDRKRLSGATKLLNKATIENPIFMCGKQIPDILLTTITVEELGDIQIPVTLKVSLLNFQVLICYLFNNTFKIIGC